MSIHNSPLSFSFSPGLYAEHLTTLIGGIKFLHASTMHKFVLAQILFAINSKPPSVVMNQII